MDEPDTPPPLDDFSARLRKAQEAQRPARENAAGPRNIGLAWRIAVEMVATVLVGGGLGWLIDEWVGSRPWGMVVFLVLGFAAGMLNAYRAAMRIAGEGQDGKAPESRRRDGDG